MNFLKEFYDSVLQILYLQAFFLVYVSIFVLFDFFKSIKECLIFESMKNYKLYEIVYTSH